MAQTMSAQALLRIVKLGWKTQSRPWDLVLVSRDAIELHGNGFALTFVSAAPIMDGPARLAPNAWLRDALSAMGKGPASFTDLGTAEAPVIRANLGDGRRLELKWLTPAADRAPHPRTDPFAPVMALDPADFAKGGAVRDVLGAAAIEVGKGGKRPELCAVHLGAQDASATNGTRLAQRRLRHGARVPALVPTGLVKALCGMVDLTGPQRLEMRHNGDFVLFGGFSCPDGSHWFLAGALADVSRAPRYESVTRDLVGYRETWVDVGDLRAMWGPVKEYIAAYSDGSLVSWSDAGATTGDIATTRMDHDRENDRPVAIFGPAVLGPSIAKLSKSGIVRMAMTDDCTGFVGDDVCMGVKLDGHDVPTWVHDALSRMFRPTSAVEPRRLTPHEVLTAAFAAVVDRAFSERKGLTPEKTGELARQRVNGLALTCVKLCDNGFQVGMGNLDAAGAVLGLARPTHRSGGTFLEFDPLPYVVAASELVDQSEREARAADYATERARRAAA